jgi:hypothetical protein
MTSINLKRPLKNLPPNKYMFVQVSSSYLLTGRGMATFIKNASEGLPENTILYSEKRNLKWKVIYRMLWFHSMHVVTRFPNEKEVIGHASFGFDDNGDPLEKAIATALESGAEYILLPINHQEKPGEGEFLIVENNKT